MSEINVEPKGKKNIILNIVDQCGDILEFHAFENSLDYLEKSIATDGRFNAIDMKTNKETKFKIRRFEYDSVDEDGNRIYFVDGWRLE